MLAKGINFQVYDSGAYHQIVNVTSFNLSGTQWAEEDVTNHDATDPVKTTTTTIRDEGKISIVVSPWVPGNSYHSYLKSLSESGAANNFKITYPGSQLGSFEVSAFVTNFAFETPVNGVMKVKMDIKVNGAVTDDAAVLQSVTVTDAHAGVYVTGQKIQLTATFDEIVVVTGTPRIPVVLTSGTVYATYVSGSNSNALIFEKTFGGGDSAAATHVSITSPVDENSGDIDDVVGQDATLTFTPPDTSAFTVN